MSRHYSLHLSIVAAAAIALGGGCTAMPAKRPATEQPVATSPGEPHDETPTNTASQQATVEHRNETRNDDGRWIPRIGIGIGYSRGDERWRGLHLGIGIGL